MAGVSSQISDDIIDAIRPDLEAFASLWSALRTNYQGTNITKTVARLLHMYQPDDGVLAYEHLLRTLYVLLEDFDGDGLRLLVSMVPPPKGVPDETIEEVFHKATGFVRLNAPIFHRNISGTGDSINVNPLANTKVGEETSDLRTTIPHVETLRDRSFRNNTSNANEDSTIIRAAMKSNVSRKNDNSPKIPQRDVDSFRGFPLTEITNTQSHAKNMTHFYRPPPINFGTYPSNQAYLDYHQAQVQSGSEVQSHGMEPSTISPGYRVKWFESPLLVRKNNYAVSSGYPDLILKTSDNKYIRLPITKINGPPIANYPPYSTSTQPIYPPYYQRNPTYLRNETVSANSYCGGSMKFRNIPDRKNSFEMRRDGRQPSKAEPSKEPFSRYDILDHDYGFPKPDDNCEAQNYTSVKSCSPNNETVQKFREAVNNRQRAIQEDVYRMDIVRFDDDNVEFSPEDLNSGDFKASDGLKMSVQNFLKRAEEEKPLEHFPFPRTRLLEENNNFPPPLVSCSSPRMWKIENLPKRPGIISEKSWNSSKLHLKKSTSPFSNGNVLSTTVRENAIKEVRTKPGRKQMTTESERIGQKISSYRRGVVTGNYNEKSSEMGNNDTDLSNLKNVSNTDAASTTINTNYRTNSKVELDNYKKQYYDTLLNIQWAKMAVANSMVMSPAQASSNYDPRISQYLQQQQYLQQHQHQRIVTKPQHPVASQTSTRPGMTNIRTTGVWVRSNNCKYSACGRYAFPDQDYSTPSSSFASQPPVDEHSDASIEEDASRASHRLPPRPLVKRRKLEEIVGKLKETEKDN